MNTTKQRRENAKQKITQYLLEAHATELFVANSLSAHIAVTPESRYRDCLEMHLRETRQHASRIQKHLRSRDAGRGIVKLGYGLAQNLVGQVMAVSKLPLDLVRGLSPEEMLLKNAKDECAAEALEIASYTALEQLAREVGDTATEALAISIRKDEEHMLERLLTQELPRLVTDVATAEVAGKSQYVVRRIGAVDSARSVASMAARSLGRSAGRVARTVDAPDGPAQPGGRKPVRKPAAPSSTTRKAATRRSTGARKASTRKRGSSKRTASKA